jgi:hypothetical protein
LPAAFHPTEEQRRTVEKLSGLGLPQSSIATVLDIDEKTLRKQLRSEVDAGMTKANTAVAEFLFDAATGKRGGGDPAITAAIFWAKTTLGWNETAVTVSRPVVDRRNSVAATLGFLRWCCPFELAESRWDYPAVRPANLLCAGSRSPRRRIMAAGCC